MYKDNRHNSNQTNNQNIPTNIPLDVKSLVTTVAGAFVMGAIGGGFGIYFLARTNSFIISTHTHAISQLELDKVEVQVYEADQKRLEEKIDSIKEDLTEIKVILTSQ